MGTDYEGPMGVVRLIVATPLGVDLSPSKHHSGGHEGALVPSKVQQLKEIPKTSKQVGGLTALENEAEYQPGLMKIVQARVPLPERPESSPK